MLREYFIFHSLHKNMRYTLRHSKRFETRLDTSNYELDRSLPKGKNKKSNSINER